MDKEVLKQHVKEGLTLGAIASEMGCSKTNIRYWLKKYGLKVLGVRGGRRSWTDDNLREAVSSSFTIADVLRKLGLSLSAGHYPRIKHHVDRLGLDMSHFTGKAHGTSGLGTGRPLDEIMVENSAYNRSHLKDRLLKEGVLENKCAICGLADRWNGSPIAMVLDHINGTNNDHRLENLRMLCPNCNSQQPTFSKGSRGAVV